MAELLLHDRKIEPPYLLRRFGAQGKPERTIAGFGLPQPDAQASVLADASPLKRAVGACFSTLPAPEPAT